MMLCFVSVFEEVKSQKKRTYMDKVTDIIKTVTDYSQQSLLGDCSVDS